jgi:type II secretory pathway component PulF
VPSGSGCGYSRGPQVPGLHSSVNPSIFHQAVDALRHLWYSFEASFIELVHAESMTNKNPDRVDDPAGRGGGAISVDQLIALNDELVALIRAGLPLERGLRDAGRDLGGRLGAVTESLSARLTRGEGLAQALEAEGDRIPKIYRAVVEAGLRAGRLSVALEGLAAYARGYVETRRAIGLALFYPILILAFAYGLFVAFVVTIVPRFLEAFQSFDIAGRGVLTALNRAGHSVTYWGPILPGLLVVGILIWLYSGRAASLDAGWGGGFVSWFPWMRGILFNSQAGSYAEVLALLVEQGVPLDEALPLAAATTGDSRLQSAANHLAKSVRGGEAPREGVKELREFPALLRWLLATSEHQASLVAALRHAATTYRRRGLQQAEMVRVLLPRFLLFGIGATATVAYALALFVPLGTLLQNLTYE